MQYDKYIDEELLKKYEFKSYGHALEILHESFPEEWKELQDCLKNLKLSVNDIQTAGETSHLFRKNLMMFFILTAGVRFGFLLI